MKRTLLILACTIPFLFGPLACNSQNPVTPAQSVCPPVGTYVQLNTTPTTSTFTVNSVGVLTCFVGQGFLPAANGVIAQNGNPTNIAGPVQGGATGKVVLTITPTPATGQTSVGELWTFFSAPAITALAPANGTMGGPTVSEVVKPKAPKAQTYAVNIPTGQLKAEGQ